jgi:hypothetical protein
LPRLWPWQDGGVLMSPSAFESATGHAALVAPALAVVLLGVVALWSLSRLE